MPEADIVNQFQKIGRDIFLRGLVSSHGGNMSIRLGDEVYITRHGAMLGSLTGGDLVATGLIRDDSATPLASTELAVHRAIYKQTPALAIVHTHPPHAVAVSFGNREIVLPDMEGSYLLGTVPVIGRELLLKHGAYAHEIAGELAKNKVVVVYGHGSFAIGQSLGEAFQLTTALEQSCHVIWLLRSLGTEHPERQPPDGKA